MISSVVALNISLGLETRNSDQQKTDQGLSLVSVSDKDDSVFYVKTAENHDSRDITKLPLQRVEIKVVPLLVSSCARVDMLL